MQTTKTTAFITGGTRGIGLGIARALAQCGFNLAINGRRTPKEVRPVVQELQSLGVKCIYCAGDVSNLKLHSRWLDEIESQFGGLDLLVNNAGVAPESRADILDATEKSFDRVLSINLKGPYFLTQAVANRMITLRKASRKYRGCMVNISSVSATVASINRGDYCISKAAISMATQLWAARLAEYNIDVYEVRPGIIATDMTRAVKAKYDRLLAAGLTLEKRWGLPQDVGRAVAVLARGELSYATGQVLTIDGGLSLPRL